MTDLVICKPYQTQLYQLIKAANRNRNLITLSR